MSHGEDLDKKHTLPRPVLARDPRDLMLAEEIIRFATITDRPSTSGSTHTIKIAGNPSHILSQCTKEQNDLRGGDGTLNTQSLSAFCPVAEAETWERITRPLSLNYHEPSFQIRGDEDLVDQRLNSCPIRSREFRPNLIPVTNSILAAIARSEAAGNKSDGPIILKLVDNPEDKDKFWPTTHKDMLDMYNEDYERIIGSDYLRSSSSDSGNINEFAQMCSNKAPSTHIDDKENTLQADNREEIISKKKEVKIICSLLNTANFELRCLNKLLKTCKSFSLKNKGKVIVDDKNRSNVREESDEDDEVQELAIQDQETPNDEIDTNKSIYSRVKVCAEDDSDSETDSWTTVDPLDNESSNDSYDSDSDDSDNSKDPSELQDVNDETFGADWTEGEKLRLRIILRNMSRQIKAKELQNKRLTLKKNGRMIAQAIEHKIYAITTEIQAVHKKQLSQVALPLEEMQNYDWTEVAAMAHRSPEECRRAWELFLHPSKNNQ